MKSTNISHSFFNQTQLKMILGNRISKTPEHPNTNTNPELSTNDEEVQQTENITLIWSWSAPWNMWDEVETKTTPNNHWVETILLKLNFQNIEEREKRCKWSQCQNYINNVDAPRCQCQYKILLYCIIHMHCGQMVESWRVDTDVWSMWSCSELTPSQCGNMMATPSSPW